MEHSINRLNCSMLYRLRLSLLLWVLPIYTYAQISIGAGAAFESPFLMSKAAGGYNHYTGVPAGRLCVVYESENSTFIPSLTITIAPYILPVSKLGLTDRALLMHFGTLNMMLNGKLKKTLNNGKLLYYGIGIGATYMWGRKVSLSGDQTTLLTVLEDSADYIKTVMPQVCLSAEYRTPIGTNKHVGAGIGINLLYSYYFERNTTWRIDVVDNTYNYYKLNPKLEGHMLNPAVYVLLYYTFGD